MNYDSLKELLEMLENYGANIDNIKIDSYCADVYFESESITHYEYFTNLWRCAIYYARPQYVKFYF